MHETFVKDAENDVDRQERGDYQIPFVAERLFVSQQGAGEKATKGSGRANTQLHLLNGEGGVAEGDPGSEIEGEGDGGKETGVIVGERNCVGLAGGHGDEGSVAGGGDVGVSTDVEVDVFQALGALRILRSDFEDDIVLVELGVNDRSLGLTERTVDFLVE